jgi:hypothetical protein
MSLSALLLLLEEPTPVDGVLKNDMAATQTTKEQLRTPLSLLGWGRAVILTLCTSQAIPSHDPNTHIWIYLPLIFPTSH